MAGFGSLIGRIIKPAIERAGPAIERTVERAGKWADDLINKGDDAARAGGRAADDVADGARAGGAGGGKPPIDPPPGGPAAGAAPDAGGGVADMVKNTVGSVTSGLGGLLKKGLIYGGGGYVVYQAADAMNLVPDWIANRFGHMGNVNEMANRESEPQNRWLNGVDGRAENGVVHNSRGDANAPRTGSSQQGVGFNVNEVRGASNAIEDQAPNGEVSYLNMGESMQIKYPELTADQAATITQVWNRVLSGADFSQNGIVENPEEYETLVDGINTAFGEALRNSGQFEDGEMVVDVTESATNALSPFERTFG